MANRVWNPDNNLYYEGDEPVTPQQLEAESSATNDVVLPQDSGQTEELNRQIQELREQIAQLTGAQDTGQQAKTKDAGDKDSVSL